MDQLLDENDKPIELDSLVREAASQLVRERRMEASNLIKNFLVKSEQVAEQLRAKRQEVAKLEETLTLTLDKIKKIKAGDWSILKDNKSVTKPDSTKTATEAAADL